MFEENDNSIKILPSSSRDKSRKKTLENTIWLKAKLWRRKLSRTRKSYNDNDNDNDDIRPSGECIGLANKYNVTLGNVTDLQFKSSNINLLIHNYRESLIVLELHHCGIMNENMIEIIGECMSIRYLNLESNLLTNIPLCLSNLKQLQFLNLKRNQIGISSSVESQGQLVISKEIKEVIVRLKLLSGKLVYLNTSMNPISTLQVYRTIVLKSIPSLLGLDSHIYSDEEHFIVKGYSMSFGTEHIPGCHYSLRLPTSLITIPSEFYNYLVTINSYKQIKVQIPITEISESYPIQLNSLLNKRYKLLKNIRIMSSPLCKIQRIVRKFLSHTKYHVFRKVLPKLQALVRRKLLHWKINNEMFWILCSANLGHLINPEDNGLTKEEIELKVVMTTIKKFLRQCLLKARYNKCATRIQRKFRAIFNSKNAHLKWLQKNMTKGIIVTSDCLYSTINILEDIFRRRNSGHDINTFKFEDVVKKELNMTISEQKVTDYDKTYIIEDVCNMKLHLSTSYHKLKKKNITKVIYQPFPRRKHESISYLFNKRNSTLKNAGTYKILQYVRTFDKYSTSFYKIKSRGNIISDLEKVDVAYVLANKSYRYYATAMSLSRLIVHDPRALCDLGITLKGLNIRFNYDTVVYRNAAAVVIQRAYRGKCVRAAYAKEYIQKLIRRRAIIAVQRWWRYSNTLKRRMNLHSFISKCCRALTSNVVYLDSWTFFAALKAETLPGLINNIKLFPEFRGVPAVDESGSCCFKYLHSDYMGFMERELGLSKSESRVELSVHDSSKSLSNEKENDGEVGVAYSLYGSLFESSKNNFNPKDRVRFGLPKWAFWSTAQKLKPNEVPLTVNSRRDSKFAMYDIMTKGSSISMKIIKPKFSDDLYHHLQETLPTDTLGMHVVEIKFRNIQEARERCALLILASYDYRSHTSIVMSSADDMMKKINNRCTDIAKALLLSNKERTLSYNNDDDYEFEIGGSYDPNKSRIGSHITPIEIKVQYNYCPKWVQDYDYDIRDLIRFRFMCESLKQLMRDKQFTTQTNYDDFCFIDNDININKKIVIENEIDENGADDKLRVNPDQYQPVASMENSQTSTNYHEQKYILDWDPEISSLYGHNYSLLSSVNVDPGQPIPIIPTGSAFIEPSNLDNFLIDKVRPNTSPKLTSNYKILETYESIRRILLWCSRDNCFDILKGGYDDKKVNLFSLRQPVLLGTTEESSISRLETIILAEYNSYVQRCNSRHTEREKPQSSSAISRHMRSAKPESIIDVIHKEYDEDEVAILYNVRRVFGCKEVDDQPSTDLEWKEKLAKAKYDSACKSRQEKDLMLKRINVQNAFEEFAKKDIVRNVIKSRGESHEKIARKLLERDQNIMSREAKSREAKSREAKSREAKSREAKSRKVNVNSDDSSAPSRNIDNSDIDKVTNDMDSIHKQYKDKLRSNVLAHKQQKLEKQAERLFCQNLQKSFNALIKKTEADNKSNHKGKPPSSSSLLCSDNEIEVVSMTSQQHLAKDNSVYNPATISLASEQVSYKSIGVHPIPTSNTLQRRISFTEIAADELPPKVDGFDKKVIAKIMASKKYSPVTVKSQKKSGSFTVTLPSISTTFTDATTDTAIKILNKMSDINDIPDKLPII